MTTRVRIPAGRDEATIVPVLIPSLDDVRAFSDELHARGQAWAGEAFGWQAEYSPQRAEPPLDSAMSFTPADFVIGDSGIWFFSRMWEDGRDAPPIEYLDDRNVIRS